MRRTLYRTQAGSANSVAQFSHTQAETYGARNQSEDTEYHEQDFHSCLRDRWIGRNPMKEVRQSAITMT